MQKVCPEAGPWPSAGRWGACVCASPPIVTGVAAAIQRGPLCSPASSHSVFCPLLPPAHSDLSMGIFLSKPGYILEGSMMAVGTSSVFCSSETWLLLGQREALTSSALGWLSCRLAQPPMCGPACPGGVSTLVSGKASLLLLVCQLCTLPSV